MDERLTIRPIRATDDPDVARIIRNVMPEFGAKGPGFAINDPEVDFMTAAYGRPRAAYFVVTDGDRVIGGGGIAPLENGDDRVCELRKMYFLPEARGRGAGAALLQRCLDAARGFAYATCYLETLARMDAARKLYGRFGFRPLCVPMGNTGHFSCDSYYSLDLTAKT
ncbi:MAG TPA: GNAT family N-acetyltransferase [Polyangia bacterium]|nr:GNAT family N-acetyltransferase [Polyangia bacterium]